MRNIVETERSLQNVSEIDVALMKRVKRAGFSDKQIGIVTKKTEMEVRELSQKTWRTAFHQTNRHARRRIPC